MQHGWNMDRLESLQVKLTALAERFYDFGSGLLKIWSPLGAWLRRRLSKSPSLLGVELFVAISLAVYYFFLMFPQPAAPRPIDGNEMNAYLFTYLSDHPYSRKDIAHDFSTWKTRLAGPMISGWVFDQAYNYYAKSSGNHPPNLATPKIVYGGYRFSPWSIVFGAYQATWLFLLYLILILHRRDALWIMLGVFSGLMYNFIIPAGQWFYPWDMPAMFFFTWACLLYEKGQLFPLLVVAWVGSLFKETALVCTLLVFLSDRWTWKKRIAGFVGTIIVCALTRKLLMIDYNVHTLLFSANHANNLHQMIVKPWSVLVYNLDYLLTFNLNNALFINAGALFIMLLLPWRTRRGAGLKILALVFVICAFFFGGYSVFAEFRDWYELLPLGWMMISECFSGQIAALPAGQTETGATEPKPAANLTRRVMQGSYWLTMTALVVLAAGVLAVNSLTRPKSKQGVESQAAAAQTKKNAHFMVDLKSQAEKGDAHAQLELAKRFLTGIGVPVTPAIAFHWFRKAAEQGLPEAEDQLGLCYFDGKGTTKDLAAGIPWFRKAANQGYVDAEYNLGLLYQNGLGVKPDLNKAANWYQRAAAKGQVLSQNRLGLILYESKKDYAGAAGWFQRAADKGNAAAQNSLGVLYLKGLGVKRNLNEALKWFQRAAQQGLAEGQYNCGALLFAAQRFNEAAYWLLKAANQGYADAQYRIAELYQNGPQLPKNMGQAVFWYAKAANQGDGQAQLALGKIYSTGQGVRVDRIAACKFFKLARLQGVPGAKQELAHCEAVMSQPQINAAEEEVKQFQK